MSEIGDANSELLKAHLAFIVPLRIIEIRQEGREWTEHMARVRTYMPDILERGELLFHYEKGTSNRLASKVADAIAVLSFVPGGISLFGLHFESEVYVEDQVPDEVTITPWKKGA